MPLFTLAELRELDVVIRVPEDEIRYVAAGQEIGFEIPALPDLGPMTAKVQRIGMFGDPLNRTYPVELRVTNPDLRIRVGMLARATVEQIHRPSAIVVPRDAIIDARHGRFAFVVEGGVARSIPVTLGPQAGDKVIVEEGLSAGARLVVMGQRQLAEGDPVRIIGGPGAEAPDAAAAATGGSAP
jgi:membrane fusion protein (multidrug efflux system)